eukprot:m.435150 g.435150  ORF g.435150 m.435150 type:complete len:90 (+) comp20255_c1_seq1:1466-1735(+)
MVCPFCSHDIPVAATGTGGAVQLCGCCRGLWTALREDYGYGDRNPTDSAEHDSDYQGTTDDSSDAESECSEEPTESDLEFIVSDRETPT